MNIKWRNGFALEVRMDQETVIISGNREGLLSLAEQLITLAEAAPGCHIHYDEYGSLDEGSAEMIIEKVL